MRSDLIANAAISIAADKNKVWQALVTPDAIKQYMFGAEVETDWRVGSEITWSGEFNGKHYEDKGKILRLEPKRTLCYSHYSPMSGKPDKPKNYHTVTIQLAENGDTTRVSLMQDKNADAKSKAESEQNWKVILRGLKHCVEATS